MNEDEKLIEAKRWIVESRIEKTLRAISRNNMEGIYAKDRQSAREEVLKRIPRNATVTHGGTYTLRELGIIEALRKGEYRYLREEGGSDAHNREAQIKAFSADVYLTSVNAITMGGDLIALDGFGNRVACLLFGPAKVVVVAGQNKIVETLEDGIKRIRDYAAPVHVKRRGWDLPCAKAGK